jgi:hypothetical protein
VRKQGQALVSNNRRNKITSISLTNEHVHRRRKVEEKEGELHRVVWLVQFAILLLLSVLHNKCATINVTAGRNWSMFTEHSSSFVTVVARGGREHL